MSMKKLIKCVKKNENIEAFRQKSKVKNDT